MYDKDFPEDFPSKSKKRSLRRSKIYYIRKKAKKFAKNILRIPEAAADNYAQQHKDNCSIGCDCWMCRNPRKVNDGKTASSLTFQEIKQNSKEKHDQ